MKTPASVKPTALLLVLATLAGCAVSSSAPPEVIALGRDKIEGPCVATRGWKDPAVDNAFAYSYFVNCNRSATTRPQAALRLVPDTAASLKAIDAHLQCGEAVSVQTLAGPAEARQCHDYALGANTMRFDIKLGKQRLIASTAEALLGPVEQGMAILAGKPLADASADTVTTVKLHYADLPAAPAGDEGGAFAVPAAAAIFDPENALLRGISLNRRGLHADASRVLNDALTRVPANAQAALRVNLLLEAGLADSNISFANSAREHFAEAEALMATVPATEKEFLTRKQGTYAALDKINRRQFGGALTSLADTDSGASGAAQLPLRNLTAMRALNRGGMSARDASSAVAVSNSAQLNELMLDAQGNWARSVALLARGDTAAANTALASAVNAYTALHDNRVEPGAILWLGARIERQRARIAVKMGEWQQARDSFEASLRMLRTNAALSAGTQTEPVIAETQLEYASAMASRPGAQFKDVRGDYSLAVKAVIASREVGTRLPSGIERYFDGLVAEVKTGALSDTYENFFEAMQATGEPAVARQLSQLRNIVSNDTDIAQAVRDRDDAGSEIVRISAAIAKLPADAAPVAREELEHDRGLQEARLSAANSLLANDARYQAVNDKPATLAEIRGAGGLGEGEAFLKIVSLDDRIFGILVTRSETFIYTIAGSAAERRDVETLAATVRGSIDGRMKAESMLDPFDTEDAYKLFMRIAGPAEARAALLNATALVVDPSGPLERLPIAVLVTSLDPINPKAKRVDEYDFSQTAFLARKMTISTAVSPRSFLAVRELAASKATQPFLGLGQHQPGVETGATGAVSVGFACNASRADLMALSNQMIPISSHELTTAASALGVPGAPMTIDAAFNDEAITRRGDLANYQVLHFATHGLEEGQWGCAKSPPALVTSFGDKDSDGLLSFSEIARLHLDANLVFLSACDTAAGVKDDTLARESGREETGSTLEGLVRAFLAANSRAVMATYWSVSAGKESDDLIDAFYRSARTGTIGGGLRDAQTKLMQSSEFSHPFYWGAYFVVGDSTKPLLTGTARGAGTGR